MNDAYFFSDVDFSKHLSYGGDSYADALPYPHTVIDNFLPLRVAEQLLQYFPPSNFSGYEQPDIKGFQENKLGRLQDSNFQGVNPLVVHYLNQFNGKVFIDFLEKVTGIDGLIPDPHFEGGALHQTLPNGKLEVHVDFNYDLRRSLRRRVNVLIYLNKEWKPEYGGALELWDSNLTACVESVDPIFNRCAIFSTGSNTYHGHPHPLRCPDGMTRKSIALYYYTADKKDSISLENHSTIWKIGKKPARAQSFNYKNLILMALKKIRISSGGK